MPSASIISSDSESNSGDWQDDSTISFLCPCTPCTLTFDSPETLFSHCLESHSLDFYKTVKGCDVYQRIRLINFLRSGYTDVESGAWKTDDTFLKPVLEDDAILYALLEDDDDVEEESIDEKYEALVKEFSDYKIKVRDTYLESRDISPADLNSKPIADDTPDYYFNSYADSGTLLSSNNLRNP
jgi:hypothetical protein